MKDICLFISDQHAGQVQGYAGDQWIRTPNLDRIAAEGTAMMNAYTPFPICVPARMAMMSGQYASRAHVLNNKCALDSNRATFVHCLSASGYATTLCGRMHFVGPDQRHGFQKRIAGDITQIYHNRPAAIAEERGVHDKTLQGSPTCLQLIGGGNSPTLEFDRYVVEHALEYLAHSYEQPQFLCVGTYGPHHPYVAPKDLFEYYYNKIDVPVKSFDYPPHPAVIKKILEDRDPEIVRAVRAAYYGMVEFEDEQVGKVYDAFQAYLKRNHREGLFIYVSDHGDHAGYRGYYGKNTFYEPSAHIPMLFAGDGLSAGRRIQGAASLLDIGPTVCEAAEAMNLPEADGVSLWKTLCGEPDDLERTIVSEVCDRIGGAEGLISGKMAKWKNYKLIHYVNYDADDVLYDVAADPDESTNIIAEHPDIAAQLRRQMDQLCDVPLDEIKAALRRQKASESILARCDFDNAEERWHATEAARQAPDPCFSSQLTLEAWKTQLAERVKKD